VAEPARRPSEPDAPSFDRAAVERAYRLQRARRRARVARTREKRRASLRFLLVLAALVALSVYLSLTVWHEVERLFGL
jgi:fatty acid desaturase